MCQTKSGSYTCSYAEDNAWCVYLLSSLVYTALYTKSKVLERQRGVLRLFFHVGGECSRVRGRAGDAQVYPSVPFTSEGFFCYSYSSASNTCIIQVSAS